MPAKANLKIFLRRDLLSRRTRALVPYYNEYNASRKPKVDLRYEPAPDLPFPPRPATPEYNVQSAHDIDSLFGEPIYTKEEIHQQKLEELLAGDRKRKHEEEAKPQTQNAELVKLMDELNSFVSRELNAQGDERQAIRGQKLALIKEIGKLETKIRVKKVEDCKVRKDDEATLPKPIDSLSKKQFQLLQERAAKAALGEGRRQKRKREDENDEYEMMDGEDRLRAGINNNRKELQLTGRWYSRIHDYFPEPENGVDGAGVLEDLAPEERLTMRRELAEYGEKLAKTARVMKEAENKRAEERKKAAENKKIEEKKVCKACGK
ncbi:hypothetical protein N431DRAFT_355774 [Stipitochalara longipes BDJ]|nr:hypothetical protein N431DRAFT_355774 [Stipitochalara longipes BDJ]